MRRLGTFLGHIAVLRIDRVAWSVGLSITLVSPAKTAEPREMPFGLWAWTGPWNHKLDGDPDPHGKGQFWGKG